ncbi:thioredoxin domain-containing protein 2 [Physeter macrocephalus]|uniref:Thioredoxin domain-containing protein 2 n=1 Tax=Physeter macrocephalus TaxID=9755 RepID=A0A9W2WCK9_PHYMC|nr:thioredoxin domain-containing protein 2 [Physeter catodon]
MESDEAGAPEAPEMRPVNQADMNGESPSLEVLSNHVTLLIPAHTPEAFVHEVSNVRHIPAERSEVLQAMDTLPPEQGSDALGSPAQTIPPRQADTPISPTQNILPKQGDFLSSSAKTIPSEQADAPSFPEKIILPNEGGMLNSPEKTILPNQAGTPNSSTQTLSPKQADIPNSSEKNTSPKQGNTPNFPAKFILPRQGHTHKLSAKTILSKQCDTPKFSAETVLPKEGDAPKSSAETVLPKEGDTPKSLEDTIRLTEGNLQSADEAMEVLEEDLVKVILSKEDFEVALKEAGERLVAVDFSATWCRPCRSIKPLFQSLSVKHKDVVFLEVDADECEGLAKDCNIVCIPTFQFYKKEEKVGEFSGALKEKLETLITALK